MNRKPWFLVALTLAMIAYGSLYPFSFHAPLTDVSAFAHFLATWRQSPQSRGDFLVNLLFYFPLGFLLVGVFPKQLAAAAVAFATVALGATLSASMELLQYFDAGRVSCMSDFYLNTVGTLLGAIAGLAWGAKVLSLSLVSTEASLFSLLVLLAWLGWRLFPYEPVIDLHKYWRSLKPLILTPSVNPYDFFRFATMWTAVAYLAQFGLRLRNPRLVVPAAAAGVFVAKILIVDLVVTLPEVIGAVIAFAYFQLVLQTHVKAGTRLLAVLFMISIVLERLLPFQIGASPRPFEWIPFFGFLHGSMAINAKSFMQKIFLYGAGLSLLTDAGLSLAWAAGLECALLLATSIAQTQLVQRSGEITDAAIAAVLAVAFYVLTGITPTTPREAKPERR